MLLGYNHNVTYKGDVFHIQTEDSGVKNPHVITLLYREGVILCSKKTSYADILKIDSLESVVEDLMKEQHKEMMRRLKSGEFDARAFPSKEQPAPVTELVEEVAITEPPAPSPPTPEPIGGVELLFQEAVQTAPAAQPAAPQPPAAPKKEQAVSLDDAILNFFGASK
ncbi:MAG: hypothetical protein WBI04_05605 [Trichlorobacter sp.]|jgi:uncharacterized membrane protein